MSWTHVAGYCLRIFLVEPAGKLLCRLRLPVSDSRCTSRYTKTSSRGIILTHNISFIGCITLVL
jgi:hypothetical protein